MLRIQCLPGEWLTMVLLSYKTCVVDLCRYSFWIKATRGEEQSRYFCADHQEAVLKILAAVVKAKVSIHLIS